MRALFSFILHLACVGALVISCGLPEALHDLGHTLTHTENEITKSTQGPGLSAHETCWIQALVASVSQHQAQASGAPAVEASAISTPTFDAPVSNVILSREFSTWQSARGPPVV